MLKTANKSWWKATISDLTQFLSPEEIKESLKKQYPTLMDQLLPLVDEVTMKHSVQAQASFYPDSGLQSNFSVPNSEGIEGSGTIMYDSEDQPNGSYTDRLVSRKRVIDRKKMDDRRNKRKQMASKLTTAVAPGQFLTKSPGAVQPGEDIQRIVEEVQQRVRTLDRATRSTEKEHELAQQWSAEEQAVQEKSMAPLVPPKGVVTPTPTTTAPTTTPTTKTSPTDTKKTVDDAKKVMDSTNQANDSVKQLNDSIQKLLG